MSLRTSLALLALAVISGTGCGGGGGASTGSELATLSIVSDFDPATRSVPGYADALRVRLLPPSGVQLPPGFPNPFILDRSETGRVISGLTPSSLPYQFDMEALTGTSIVGRAQRSIVIRSGEVIEIDVSANLESEVDSVAVEGLPELIEGEDSQYTAFARNASGSVLFSGAGFDFQSSAPGVLTINPSSGFALASAVGSAAVSATLIGTSVAGSLTVTVSSQPRIIFMSSANGNSEIYSVLPDGSQLTNLTNNASQDGYQLASPDGSVVVFRRSSGFWGSTDKVMIMNRDGSGQQELVPNFKPTVVGGYHFASFSPDGSKLALLGSLDDAGTYPIPIYVINADGSGLSLVTTNGPPDNEFTPSFSPNGDRLVYTGTDGIRIANLDGSGSTLVSATGLGPRFSPDGSKVVFCDDGLDGVDLDIYVINADGTNKVLLTDNDALDQQPSWSPDGSSIAYYSNSFSGSTNSGALDLVVMSSDGTGKRLLSLGVGRDPFPSFRADGLQLAFARTSGGSSHTPFVVNTDGSGLAQISTHASSYPVFSK